MIRNLILLIIGCVMVTSLATAQSRQRGKSIPARQEIEEKIEGLRKVKLLDLLELKGSQVEEFFSAYNKHTDKLRELRHDIEKSAQELQGAIGNDAQESELKTKTAELRKHIQQMERTIEDRFNAVEKVLSAKQFAQYVVFEAQFKDELQRMILDRVRRARNR